VSLAESSLKIQSKTQDRAGNGEPDTGEPSKFDVFSSDLVSETGIDLSAYKKGHVKRRIDGLMARLKIPTYDEYIAVLAKDDTKRRQLVDHLSINVTEFFRDAERWEYIQNVILSPILRKQKGLFIWSAGCSIGAEPYSMSIILEEIDPYPDGRHNILATDIDQAALKKASEASYSVDALKNVSPVRLLNHFSKAGDRWVVKPSIKNKVRFMIHDLIGDPYPIGVNLVVCRNVVIYLTGEVKDRVYKQIHSALRPGGILFVGSSEIVTGWKALGFELLSPFIYEKKR
jgi:chemotaxis protein methyltransferase CheR